MTTKLINLVKDLFAKTINLSEQASSETKQPTTAETKQQETVALRSGLKAGYAYEYWL